MLIPAALTFQLALPVPRVKSIPRTKGGLLDLPESCRLFWPGENLDSSPLPFEVRAAWNEKGLGFSVRVTGRRHPPQADNDRFDEPDGFQICLHTRKARGVHRANRMCHVFVLLPTGAGPRGDQGQVRQVPVPRALENAPIWPPESFPCRTSLEKDGWQMEAWLPTECLTGFDPDASRQLGFWAVLKDSEHGEFPLTLGRAFPVASDPELWQTLELVD